jgi:hypothetical protein
VLVSPIVREDRMAIRIQLACMATFIPWAVMCSAAADPLDPKAPVAAPVHRSAFDNYRRHDDVKPLPWRQANDTVERIGGWRSYAREASQPPAAASAPQAPSAPAPRSEPPKPAPGHGGHKH